MTRRRAFPLLLLLVLLGTAAVRFAPDASAWLVQQQLAAFFHRPVTIGALRYRVVPMQLEVTDIRVAGSTPAAEPFLEVPRVTVVPSLAALFDRRVVLTQVVV